MRRRPSRIPKRAKWTGPLASGAGSIFATFPLIIIIIYGTMMHYLFFTPSIIQHKHYCLTQLVPSNRLTHHQPTPELEARRDRARPSRVSYSRQLVR